MAFSFDSIKTQDDKLDRILDDLRFICKDPSGFNSIKYEYYKEQVLNMDFYEDGNDDVLIEPEDNNLSILKPSSSVIELSGGPMDSAWPMKCHDIRHTSLSPYSTADNPYIEKWRFYTNSWIEDAPVIDNNGIIYFASTHGMVLAVNADGTEKWRFQTGGYMLGSSPAIAEDGTVYVGCWDSFLYAINSDGSLKWKFYANDANIASSPAIAEDGTIYFGDLGDFGDNTRIYAVYPNGTEKWHYTINDRIYSDPCIGDDGTIYIGSNDNYIYALNPDGTLMWKFKTGKEVGGSASIASDGTIYVYGTWDNYLYALYPNNGTFKWKCNIKCNSNPSIDSNGIIYVGGDEEFYAVYPNGTKKWTFNLGNERWVGGSYPAISADGTIYIGLSIGSSAGGEIIAINPDGSERFRKKIANRWVESSPSVAEDGTVYIGSSWEGWGYIHAFGNVESNSPPVAPSISGETNGEPGKNYWYTFRAVDPDNNPVSFYIEWGDGTTTGWTMERASGENCYYEKTYSKSGKYTIRAKVKDVFDEESPWGELTVVMPKDKSTDNMLLIRLLERFPLLHKLIFIID